MASSPLKTNYIKDIRNIKPFKPSQTQTQRKLKSTVKKVSKQKNSKQNTTQVYSDCIRSKIWPQSQNDKYFEMILFDSGIFNINLVQVCNLLSQTERKNISKLCIPNQQRLLKGLYLFPTQTIIQCQYDLQSRFNRQMITYCPGEYLIVNNFTNGRIDGEQFNFNLKDLILVKTIYQNNKIMKVTDYFFGDDEKPTFGNDSKNESKLKIKLQKYLKDRKLCQSIYQLVEARFDWLNPIETNAESSFYYGIIDQNQQLPIGLGLLINHKETRKRSKSISQFTNYEQNLDSGWQFYFGFFQYGLLNGIGQIWFQNKSSYFGEFDYGNAIGLGQYYTLESPNYSEEQFQCLSYKDDMKAIRQNDFFRWLRQSYFNGKKSYPIQKNKLFIQNQYQKLRKIYAIPKKKPIVYSEENFRRQNEDQNSEQIDDLMDQMDRLRIKDHYDPQNSQITFNRNDEIKDIFQKIKVKEKKTPKDQKKSDKKINIPQTNNKKQYEQKQIKNTSRSDGPNNKIHNNKQHQNNQNNHKSKRTYSHLNPIEEKPKQRQNDTLPRFSHQEIDQNQQIDLGYQEVNQSYFRDRQVNTTYKNHTEKDYINRQYAFEEPKKFKTPQYFMVQYGKNDPRYDPSGTKSNLTYEDKVRKSQFPGPSPFKKQKYLSPQRRKTNIINQKQNQQDLQKLQKTLNSGRNKRIFYNQTKRDLN